MRTRIPSVNGKEGQEAVDALVPKVKKAAVLDLFTMTDNDELMFSTIEWWARSVLLDPDSNRYARRSSIQIVRRAHAWDTSVVKHAREAHGYALKIFPPPED